jgi:hypothetical protein
MRYLALNGDFLERFLGPYLCRSAQAGAQAVVIRRVVERVEDVEKPGEWIDFRDMLQRYDFPPVRVSCVDAKGTEEQE